MQKLLQLAALVVMVNAFVYVCLHPGEASGYLVFVCGELVLLTAGAWRDLRTTT